MGATAAWRFEPYSQANPTSTTSTWMMQLCILTRHFHFHHIHMDDATVHSCYLFPPSTSPPSLAALSCRRQQRACFRCACSNKGVCGLAQWQACCCVDAVNEDHVVDGVPGIISHGGTHSTLGPAGSRSSKNRNCSPNITNQGSNQGCSVKARSIPGHSVLTYPILSYPYYVNIPTAPWLQACSGAV